MAMEKLHVRLCALPMLLAASAGGAELHALPEHIRPDPFGGVLQSDLARGSYVLHVKMPAPLEADLFREWFHLTRGDRVYRPDALIPVRAPYRSQIPAPDNRIEK